MAPPGRKHAAGMRRCVCFRLRAKGASARQAQRRWRELALPLPPHRRHRHIGIRRLLALHRELRGGAQLQGRGLAFVVEARAGGAHAHARSSPQSSRRRQGAASSLSPDCGRCRNAAPRRRRCRAAPAPGAPGAAAAARGGGGGASTATATTGGAGGRREAVKIGRSRVSCSTASGTAHSGLPDRGGSASPLPADRDRN